MFMLQQMQQAGQVAPTPTVKAPMIAAGPAPVQVQPAKEIQIQQPQQTEADKFKSAAKMAALNAGMSNAFKAGATKAAMTNPMAAPLAVASMFLKEGDKVPDYEQQTFRGQPIDWSNPWEYAGMDKMTAAETFKEESPSSGFSTKFARKMGGQDFSTEGPGVGSQRYIPELDMNNWQKYGYDYGKIKEMFLDNPANRTSEPYQAFLWSHMSTPQRLKAMQEGGVFSNWGVRDYLETGDDNAWRKYVPQEVQLDGPYDPWGPKPPGMSDDDWEWWRWSETYIPKIEEEEVPFSDDGRWDPDLYYSKGNKVKKPGYYNEGEEVQGGTPWWRLGPLARLFGKPPGGFGRGRSIPSVIQGPGGAGDVAQWRLNKIVKEHNTPSDFMDDFERKLARMSKEQRKLFWANYDKLGRQGQIDYLNAREAEFNHQLKNRKMKEYVNSLESEKKIRRELEKHGSKKPFKPSDIKPWDMDQIKKDSEQFNRAMDKLEKGKKDKKILDLMNMSSPEAQQINLETEDGKPVKGSDLMSKDLENYTSKWNKFKRGITKFAAPLAGPFAWPLAAAGTLLDAGPLSNYKIDHDNDFTPHVEPPIFDQEERDYMRKRQLWDQVHQEQQNQIRNDFAPFEEKEPVVYKQHGGAALDNAIDYFNNWRTQGQPSIRSGYPASFHSASMGSNDNSSFTDQVMDGNVNVWGPLSLGFGGNNPFGGQVGFGTSVPLMGGKPQW